ncbi:MAG: hypothetical protein KC776_03220 [Myxococcales bacterium]|nr:hypothetical protein [Myxococcales bacterium]MCB9580000.1 hypothetical protein [Polyangiaceae bacterium]
MKPPVKHRKDGGHAFIRDPEGGAAHSRDALAEGLAETFLESATSGEEQAEEVMNELVSEELGGPFLEEAIPLEPETSRPPRRKHRRR